MPRVRKIRSGDGRFTPFDREEGFTRYQGWTATALVGEFAQLRRANLAALDAICLTITDLDAVGEHPEFGRDVGPWAAYFSLLKDWEAPRPA